MYRISVPIRVMQITDTDGSVSPISFEWTENGETVIVEIDRVRKVTPHAELKSGIVGDKFDCIIDGLPDCIYYTKLQPRRWVKVVDVSKEVYEEFYALPE